MHDQDQIYNLDAVKSPLDVHWDLQYLQSKIERFLSGAPWFTVGMP